MPRDDRNSELRIEFYERVDGRGKKYYLAKPRLPVTIDLADAALFFWVEDGDGPSLTVCVAREKSIDKGSDSKDETRMRRPITAFGED